MFSEIPNLPDSTNELPHHLKIKKSPSVSKFKKRINRFFRQIEHLFDKQKGRGKELALTGRIHELEPLGREVLNALLSLKKSIAQHSDPYLVSAAHALIDPIIREMKKLLEQREGKHSPAQQVKVYNRYVEYLDKGKAWISNLSCQANGEEIQAFIKMQVIDEFHARIDRDLQLIQDYMDHSLAQAGLSHLFKDTVAVQMRNQLAPLLENLKSLKNFPLENRMETFFKWRTKADYAREKWMSDALQIVDAQANALFLNKEHN